MRSQRRCRCISIDRNDVKTAVPEQGDQAVPAGQVGGADGEESAALFDPRHHALGEDGATLVQEPVTELLPHAIAAAECGVPASQHI